MSKNSKDYLMLDVVSMRYKKPETGFDAILEDEPNWDEMGLGESRSVAEDALVPKIEAVKKKKLFYKSDVRGVEEIENGLCLFVTEYGNFMVYMSMKKAEKLIFKKRKKK